MACGAVSGFITRNVRLTLTRFVFVLTNCTQPLWCRDGPTYLVGTARCTSPRLWSSRGT